MFSGKKRKYFYALSQSRISFFRDWEGERTFEELYKRKPGPMFTQRGWLRGYKQRNLSNNLEPGTFAYLKIEYGEDDKLHFTCYRLPFYLESYQETPKYTLIEMSIEVRNEKGDLLAKGYKNFFEEFVSKQQQMYADFDRSQRIDMDDEYLDSVQGNRSTVEMFFRNELCNEEEDSLKFESVANPLAGIKDKLYFDFEYIVMVDHQKQACYKTSNKGWFILDLGMKKTVEYLKNKGVL